MSDTPKKMTVKEFRELGYLQHLQRTCLHPLGLALEVIRDAEGNESFGLIWDNRDDPEGMVFDSGMIEPEKARRINTELETKHYFRMAKLGFVVQPDTPEEQDRMLKEALADTAYSRSMGYDGRCILYGEAVARKWLEEELRKDGYERGSSS